MRERELAHFFLRSGKARQDAVAGRRSVGGLGTFHRLDETRDSGRLGFFSSSLLLQR